MPARLVLHTLDWRCAYDLHAFASGHHFETALLESELGGFYIAIMSALTGKHGEDD